MRTATNSLRSRLLVCLSLLALTVAVGAQQQAIAADHLATTVVVSETETWPIPPPPPRP